MSNTPDIQHPTIHWYDLPGLAIFFALMLVVFLQFFTRYVLNDSLAWTEEIARYLLILMVYSGAISALARSEHIALEVVVRYAPVVNARPLAVQSEVVSMCFYLVLTIGASVLAYTNEQTLISVAVPKAHIYGFIALCGFGLCLFTLVRLRQRLNQNAKEIHAELLDSGSDEGSS